MAQALSDIVRNNVKEKLARDEVVSSITVRLVRGIEIVRIAKTAGFDSLYVDLEHSSLSVDATGQICMAALEAGIAPFVRVPANTGENIQRALDGKSLYRTFGEAGIQMAWAEEVVEPGLADEREAAQLQIADGALVLRVTRIVFDDRNEPVEFVRLVYNAGVYTYRTTLYGKQRAPNGR